MNFLHSQDMMSWWVTRCESCLNALSARQHCYVSCEVSPLIRTFWPRTDTGFYCRTMTLATFPHFPRLTPIFFPLITSDIVDRQSNLLGLSWAVVHKARHHWALGRWCNEKISMQVIASNMKVRKQLKPSQREKNRTMKMVLAKGRSRQVQSPQSFNSLLHNIMYWWSESALIAGVFWGRVDGLSKSAGLCLWFARGCLAVSQIQVCLSLVDQISFPWWCWRDPNWFQMTRTTVVSQTRGKLVEVMWLSVKKVPPWPTHSH